MKKLLTIIVLSSFLVACSQEMMNKENAGLLIGGATGAFIGSKVGGGNGRMFATAAGALLGAMAGKEIGKQLDQYDLMMHENAVEESYQAPLHKTISWENEKNGHRGTVTPVKEGRDEQQNICRQYEQTITVDGRTETAVGTACKNNDGTWSIIK